MTSKKIIFTGRVQGVGFRYITKQLALGFEIVGWVKNLADGTVELQIMGEDDEVDDFIREIIEESELSPLIKEHTIWEIDPLSGAKGFRIV